MRFCQKFPWLFNRNKPTANVHCYPDHWVSLLMCSVLSTHFLLLWEVLWHSIGMAMQSLQWLTNPSRRLERNFVQNSANLPQRFVRCQPFLRSDTGFWLDHMFQGQLNISSRWWGLIAITSKMHCGNSLLWFFFF